MSFRTACLFPAFAMRYEEFRRDDLPGYAEVVEPLLERAAAIVRIDRDKFERPDAVVLPDELEDDLQAQYACYVNNIAMGDLFERRFGRCDCVAGYSMGLFSGLCHAEAVTFEDGLSLMREICVRAHQAATAGAFSMGAVMGLTLAEVAGVIGEVCPTVEISDVCGKRVIIFSGWRDDVEKTIAACMNFGALNSRQIPVKLPFHSSFLAAVEPQAAEIVAGIPVQAPRCEVVSSITQDVLVTAEDVRREVTRNVARPMNWFATMRKLLDMEVDRLLECGISEDLTKLAQRNVRGRYTMLNLFDLQRPAAEPPSGDSH